MSILDNLLARAGYRKATQMAPLLQATGEGQQYTVPDLTLAEAQEQLFERLSWVYGAVMAVATMVASATLSVKKLRGEKREDVPNHPFELRLMRPNPLDSRTELMVKLASYYALTGNAYLWLLRRNPANPKQEPDEMWVLPSHQVTPIPDGKMFIKGYDYDPGLGQDHQIILPHNMVHIKRFHPRNWFVGLSPVEALAVVAEGDLKAQRWNTNFFGANNAKVPGALSFGDRLGNTAWDALKQQVKEQWGGTQRNGPLMLNGVGQGGATWVQMGLSQSDMEFLGARTFTKEEIYSIFAPGLASVLDVNATEANAKAGKATFAELAVWPVCVAIAEKLTNNLLPVYGDNLVAEFDDVRVVDRVLEMQEQEAYGRVHTINEMRAKYYDDDPLEDERGEMFPAQIGASTAMPQDEDEAQDDMPPMTPLAGGQAQEQPAAEQEPPPLAPMDGEQADGNQALQAEIKAWRRYALRHGRDKAQAFACEHVPDAMAAAICTALAAATTPDEIKAAFKVNWAEIKQAAPPSPDDDERQDHERKIADAMTTYFAAQRQRIEREMRRATA